MALRTGSLVAITGPRSAAVGAPQRSGEGVFDASEEARLAVSNSVLRSFMVITSLRAKRRARRSAAQALTHFGPRKNTQNNPRTNFWQGAFRLYLRVPASPIRSGIAPRVKSRGYEVMTGAAETMTQRKISRVAVFCGSNVGQGGAYVKAAAALGRELAGRRIGLVFGGTMKGLMGVLADATLDAGGSAHGVITRR